MRKNRTTTRTSHARASGWLWIYIRRQGWRFALAALVGLLAAGCAGGLLFTSGYLISRSSLQPYNILMVYVPIVLVRTFGFSKAVFTYLERLISHDTVLRILSSMRVRLYHAVEPYAVRLRSRYQTGDFLGLVAEDIEQLQQVYLRLALPAVTAVLIYGAGIAVLGYMDGPFALLMALYCGFLLFTVPAYTLLRSRRTRERHVAERQQLYREVTDSVFGMSDWLLSGRTAQFLDTFHARRSAMFDLERRIRRREWRIEWFMHIMIGFAVVLVTVWAGAMSSAGRIAPEWIAACAFVVFPLLETFLRAAQAIEAAPDYRESLLRLRQVEQPTAMDTDSGTLRQSTALQFPSVELDRVSFRYPDTDNYTLNDFSLIVPEGARIALLGRSGAGKSTLFLMLQGELSPERGSVRIGGMEAAEARQKGLFSVMNQTPYLFDTSIANNIRLGRPEASDEEVIEAATKAGLGQLIRSLPQGILTPVYEAGTRFSGGERQRIALARVLLQNRPIVLLDEPTVGLDPITEKQLVDTLHETLQGKTIIWITHHLSGMERMDRIIFMEQGRILMQGTHEQLYKQNKRYRKLYMLDQPFELEL